MRVRAHRMLLTRGDDARRFMVSPECIPSMLLLERMAENEAIIIIGKLFQCS